LEGHVVSVNPAALGDASNLFLSLHRFSVLNVNTSILKEIMFENNVFFY
jgi:hypothetical protein